MNNKAFMVRTDKDLHERIRRLAYYANISRSGAIRKLLASQDEEAQLKALLS